MGRANQPRDRRGRWTETGAGSRLGSQRQDFARALQSESASSKRDNNRRSTVYAYLRDKDSPSGKAGTPYYVGVAGDVTRPYKSHGRTPVPSDERRIRMLRQNVTHEQAREWEKHYIQQFGRKDVGSGRGMLINRTDGGEGVAGLRHSAEARAKIGAASRGRPTSAETRAKKSAASKGRIVSTETKAKMSAAAKGRVILPETKAKLSEALKGKPISSETKDKISAALKGRHPSAEARAKMSAAARNRSPDAYARSGAARRGVALSAEAKAKMTESKVRNTAARHGVNADVWSQLSRTQRSNASHGAKRNGMTVAQYVEKMRPKWGV